MEIIEALEKLGFSFWQLVLLGIAIYLRQELRMLFRRLASFKIGDKEVAFHQDKSISDLKSIKEQLKNQPLETEQIGTNRDSDYLLLTN